MTTVPLFISHTRLKKRLGPRAALPVARGSWALDSGGFTELDRHRGWQTTEDDYVAAVNRYQAEVGNLCWAAPMDWMCEPKMLAKTGLSVSDHQARTIANYIALRERGPFIPVLQGWELADYHRCVEMYDNAGVDLRDEPLVGLGTVCRRQDTPEIARVVQSLADLGLRLHGFGVKTLGLRATGHMLASADSLAWSFGAREDWRHRKIRKCGGDHRGGCANCMAWALRWRQRIVDGLGLFAEEAA